MAEQTSGESSQTVKYKLRPGVAMILQLLIGIALLLLITVLVMRLTASEGTIPEASVSDQRISVAGEQLDEDSNPIADNSGDDVLSDFSEEPDIPDASTEVSQSKASQTQLLISQTGTWYATDYEEGDINPGNYTVQQGDTLWEIAEAAYGDGALWTTILDANSSDVGFLANGSQALISPGQVLSIPLQL